MQSNAWGCLFMAGMMLAASGCVGLRGRDTSGVFGARRFPVDISNLDWVEVSYMPRPEDAVFATACRLSLMGSGEIMFRTGRSPQVWDAFSHKVDDPSWNDLYVDRLHIGQKDMQELYQQLVDAGLFPPQFSRRNVEVGTTPYIRINASIGRATAVRIIDDRKMVRIIEGVLRNFEQTALLAQGRGASQ